MNKLNSILYSFRRCPYAIRARMALALTNLSIDIIEVKLSNKPKDMLLLSPKGTVPVLYLAEERRVIDESIDIISYAHSRIEQAIFWDPKHVLIQQNDVEFKPLLDRYKYFERYPEKTQLQHRKAAYAFLAAVDEKLSRNTYLAGRDQSLLDIAVMPFIRQFAFVDKAWWQEQSLFPCLKSWLEMYLHSELFLKVMQKNLQLLVNDHLGK